MRTCFIIGAGEEQPLDFIKKDGDMVVACDGGLKYLEKQGIIPDAIIGDFDSLGYVPAGERVTKLNVIKDETDVGAALRIYGEKYDRFLLYCCTGGRISHTLANVQNGIKLAKQDKEVIIFDKCEVITFLHNCSKTYEKAGESFSVLSIGTSKDVTITGAKYEITNATLTDDFPLGVSNEFTADKTEIKVGEGTVMVILKSEVCAI